ncbi:hypothetical protein GWC77_19715 [Paraburkholderia sp. NMBU_R16]|uniref:hypothetical protein n=1 Tax=Paraburkholderia sp. NMBU_R16 TaxID=2698676 RepID=UPI001565216F|nr:hypothetical protein [Paraburkholderia sp. NMBU_R16]NRO98158.1 hypothetical protein [Paraburkholderia sp. NMBU_R16]
MLAALPHRLTSGDTNGARRWGVSASVAWILFGFAIVFGAIVAIDEHDNAQMLWPTAADPPSHETQRTQEDVPQADRAPHRQDAPAAPATPAASRSPLQALSSAALVDLLRQQLDTVRHENAADAQRTLGGPPAHNGPAVVAPGGEPVNSTAATLAAKRAAASAAAAPRKPVSSTLAKKAAPQPSVPAHRLPAPVAAPLRPSASPAPSTPQSEALASTRPAASGPSRATAVPAARPTADTAEAPATQARTLPPSPASAAQAPRIAEQPVTPEAETSPVPAGPSSAPSTSAAPAALAMPAVIPAPAERGDEAHPRLRPGCAAGGDGADCKETAAPPDTSGSRIPPAGQSNEVWSGAVKRAPAASAAMASGPDHEQAAQTQMQTSTKRVAKGHTPKQRVASAASSRAVRRATERTATAEHTEEHGAASSPLAMAKQTWHTVLSEIEPRERLKPARTTELSASHTEIYRGH